MNSLSAFHSRFLRCAQFLFRDWQLLNLSSRKGEGGERERETFRGRKSKCICYTKAWKEDFAASYLYC